MENIIIPRESKNPLEEVDATVLPIMAPINVAFSYYGRVESQCSTYGTPHDYLAIYGNLNGVWNKGILTHTKYEAYA